MDLTTETRDTSQGPHKVKGQDGTKMAKKEGEGSLWQSDKVGLSILQTSF